MCCAQLAPGYEQSGQYSVPYVAALFKELQFQAEATEMVEAAKPEIPALIMIGLNSIMPFRRLRSIADCLSFSQPWWSTDNRPGASYVDSARES